ncbi:MAG: MFS transporter [Acidihalobacter sp.]
MAKYRQYERPEIEKQDPLEVHPIWRGIGCIFLIIMPIVAYAGALLLLEANNSQHWIRVPAELSQSVTLPVLGVMPHLYATLVVTGLLLSLGVGLTGVAWTLPLLIAGQALAGLGAGAMLPAAYAATAVIAPKGLESRVLGKVIAGWSISLVAAVPTSALIADYLNWRIAYLAITLISLAAVGGFTTLPADGHTSGQQRSTIRESLAVERALGTLAVIFLFMCAFYGTYTFLGTHIQADLKESTAAAGLAVLSYGAGFGVASFWGGRIIDRYTPVVLAGPMLLAIGVLYFIAIPASDALLWLTVWCFAWGVLNQFALNCLLTLLTQLSKAHRLRLLGLYSVAAYGGAMVAAIVFGQLYAAAGFGTILGLAGILCLTGWGIALRWRGMSQKQLAK